MPNPAKWIKRIFLSEKKQLVERQTVKSPDLTSEINYKPTLSENFQDAAYYVFESFYNLSKYLWEWCIDDPMLEDETDIDRGMRDRKLKSQAAERKLKSKLAERSWKLNQQYRSDQANIKRRADVCEDWKTTTLQKLKERFNRDKNIFIDSDTPDPENTPGWKIEPSNKMKQANELCEDLGCNKLPDIAKDHLISSDAPFQHQVEMSKLIRENEILKRAIEKARSDFQDCNEYVQDEIKNQNFDYNPNYKNFNQNYKNTNQQSHSYPNSNRRLALPGPDSSTVRPENIANENMATASSIIESKTIFDRLLNILIYPARVGIGDIILINRRQGMGPSKWVANTIFIPLFHLIIAIFCYYIYYWILSNIVFPILKSTLDSLLSYLPEKREERPSYNSYSGDHEDEEIAARKLEPKGFWRKALGSFSNILVIKRGGSITPLEEIPINSLTKIDSDYLLMQASGIQYLIKIQRNRTKIINLLEKHRRITSFPKVNLGKLKTTSQFLMASLALLFSQTNAKQHAQYFRYHKILATESKIHILVRCDKTILDENQIKLHIDGKKYQKIPAKSRKVIKKRRKKSKKFNRQIHTLSNLELIDKELLDVLEEKNRPNIEKNQPNTEHRPIRIRVG